MPEHRDRDVAGIVAQVSTGVRAASSRRGPRRRTCRSARRGRAWRPRRCSRRGRAATWSAPAPVRPVAGVGDDDDVRCELGSVGGRSVANVGEPTSSSPSTKTVTPTPSSSPSTRSAPTWATIPALSSAAPRPYNRPSRSTGSNGGLSQAASSPAVDVVVGVQQDGRRTGRAGRWATTAGAPRGTVSTWTSSDARPRAGAPRRRRRSRRRAPGRTRRWTRSGSGRGPRGRRAVRRTRTRSWTAGRPWRSPGEDGEDRKGGQTSVTDRHRYSTTLAGCSDAATTPSP